MEELLNKGFQLAHIFYDIFYLLTKPYKGPEAIGQMVGCLPCAGNLGSISSIIYSPSSTSRSRFWDESKEKALNPQKNVKEKERIKKSDKRNEIPGPDKVKI